MPNGKYPVLMDESQLPDVNAPGYQQYGKPIIDVDKIAEQLKDIQVRISSAFKDVAPSKFGLQSIELQLTVGAEGGIWFLAKGSVGGSITLTFAVPDAAG
jgi:hypothetical protein